MFEAVLNLGSILPIYDVAISVMCTGGLHTGPNSCPLQLCVVMLGAAYAYCFVVEQCYIYATSGALTCNMLTICCFSHARVDKLKLPV